MGDAWYAFARDGVPIAPNGEPWQPYTADDHVQMVIDEKGWQELRDINEKNNELLRPMCDVLIRESA